ncbi:MAG: hypothetical protein ABL958_21350 [Bdellovibrionia bacterium]
MKYFQMAFFAVFLFAMACGTRPNPSSDENEDIARAYKLIDRDRPQEAIDLLEPRLKTNPKRLVLKTALASAYASRAGIRVPRYAPLVIELMKTGLQPDPETESLVVTRLRGLNIGSLREEQAKRALSDVFAFADLIRRFDRLPDIEDEREPDLARARELLEDVPEGDRGVRLYRAVLGAIDVRYSLKRRLVPAHFTAKRGSSCEVELKPLLKDISAVAERVAQVGRDLEAAMPEQLGRSAEYLNELNLIAGKINEAMAAIDFEPRVTWECE